MLHAIIEVFTEFAVWVGFAAVCGLIILAVVLALGAVLFLVDAVYDNLTGKELFKSKERDDEQSRA